MQILQAAEESDEEKENEDVESGSDSENDEEEMPGMSLKPSSANKQENRTSKTHVTNSIVIRIVRQRK